MALTLINRTARRVGVAMTADGGLFYPDEGYKALSVNTGHPARIMPPRGVWTITVSGAAVTGVTPAIGQADILATSGEVKFTRYYTGSESMLVKTNTTGATCTVVLEEAPPCVNAFWRVWGWHRGAKEDHDHHQRLRPRLVRHSLRRARGATAAGLQRWGLHPAGRVHARCGLHIRVPGRETRHAHKRNRHRYRHEHLAHRHLPSRLTPAGGEHRGA